MTLETGHDYFQEPKPFPMIIGEDYINIIVDGKPCTVAKTHANYPKLIQAIKDKDLEAQRQYSDIVGLIAGSSDGKITIEDDTVLYKGLPVHNVVADRILRMLSEGFDVEPMILFLENLMKNPVSYAINELYEFLAANELPITSDGHLLAYKVVRDNYLDKHSGTMDNSVGKVVKMDRDLCNTNRNEHCSTGLHFCGLKYLNGFGSGDDKVVIVKINPKDVTSFPSDNFAKGRCCEYLVDSLYGDYREVASIHKWGVSVANSEYEPELPEEEETYDDWDQSSSEEDYDYDYDSSSEEDDVPLNLTETDLADEIVRTGNPIKDARTLAGFSGKELASFAGYSDSTLYSSEKASNSPKLETVERWIDSINDLLRLRHKDFQIGFDPSRWEIYKK